MDVWEILGINPTNDLSSIKKAYAAKLKIHHPEDDPEGYQRLREAYDLVIKLSKNSNSEKVHFNNNSDTNRSDWGDNSSTKLNKSNNFNNIYWTKSKTSSENEINFDQLNADFVNQANSLYWNFTSRIDINKWNSLFDSDVIWNMNNREEINYLMLEFVSEHKYFPQEIWKLFDSTFNWKEQEDLKYTTFSGIYDYIVRQFNETRSLNYSFIRCNEPFYFDKYLYYRECAYDSLLKKNQNDILMYLKKAKEIYPGDPELLYVEAMYFYQLRKEKKSLALLNQAIAIDSNNSRYFIIRAKANMKSGQISNAIEDLEAALRINPECKEILPLISRCYYRHKEYEKARKFIQMTLAANPRNHAFKVLLFKSETSLKRNIKKALKAHPEDDQLKKDYKTIQQEESFESKKMQRKTLLFKVFAAISVPLLMGFMFICYWLDGYAHDLNSHSENITSKLILSVRDLAYDDIKVKGSAKQVTVLPLLCTEVKDDSGSDFTAISPIDNNSFVQPNENDKSVSISEIANNKYIILASIKSNNFDSFFSASYHPGSIKTIIPDHPIKLKGTLKDITSSDLVDAIKSVLASNSSKESILSNLNTDQYIELEDSNKTDELFGILMCIFCPIGMFCFGFAIVLRDWYKKYSFKDVV